MNISRHYLIRSMHCFRVRCGACARGSPICGGLLRSSQLHPLTKSEYQRFLSASPSEQMKNIWVLAINTGMRHGEICALSWEDIDAKNWTITSRRNMAVINHFTPPKTGSGNREIRLTYPAIEALKNQMAMTRLGECHDITVNLREFAKKRVDQCTFVFCPKISARNGNGGHWYSLGSIGTAGIPC